MNQDTLMLYKLMVLYMLNKVDFPPFRYRIDPNRTYPQQFLLFHEPVR